MGGRRRLGNRVKKADELEALRLALTKVKEAQDIMDRLLECEHRQNILMCVPCKVNNYHVHYNEIDSELQETRDHINTVIEFMGEKSDEQSI